MAINKFRGLGVALITPFKEDSSIDYDALNRLVEYQIQGGVDFLCIMGTTAETPTLTLDEKRSLKDFLTERVAGRVPILMGCGGNSTAFVIKELQTFDWTGIDGVLSVCPYYNKPSQEGLYQHFTAIANESPVPVVLYNVPGTAKKARFFFDYFCFRNYLIYSSAQNFCTSSSVPTFSDRRLRDSVSRVSFACSSRSIASAIASGSIGTITPLTPSVIIYGLPP